MKINPYKLAATFLITSLAISFAGPVAFAVQNVPAVDLNQTPTANSPFGAFKLVQCDGPNLPASLIPTDSAQFQQKFGHMPPYVPCDFKGLMIEVQFLINAMLVVGVLAAMIGFAYSGFLYITGTQENLKKAKGIFPKIFWGFIMMLVAWFVVYQITVWLTGSSSYLQ